MLSRVFAASLAAWQCSASAVKCKDIGWTYNNFDWDKLGMCSHKGDQSPIDISTNKVSSNVPLGPLKLKDGKGSGKGTIQLNEHTWQVNLKAVDAGIEWDGDFYAMSQFHFHAPSETTVNGKHSDMEMHMVHANKKGRILVVAYLFEAGPSANAYLARFWNDFPTHDGSVSETSVPAPYHDRGAYSSAGAYFAYEGSLTTPPCTNDTQWIVMTEPATMSREQLEKYRSSITKPRCTQLGHISKAPAGVALPWDLKLGVNNRPTQPLGSRTVYEFKGVPRGWTALMEMEPPSPAVLGAMAALSVAVPVAAVAAIVRRRMGQQERYVAMA